MENVLYSKYIEHLLMTQRKLICVCHKTEFIFYDDQPNYLALLRGP